METLLLNIIERLREDGSLSARELAHLIDVENSKAGTPERRYAKKKLLPYYFKVKREDFARWESWDVTPELERALLRTLRMKPRRTASGVATITVITKPWPCSDDCLYCPSDMRMPKSYLHNEPACQRAERNFFDPFLQVSSRLRALIEMGHICDKVELIILGGTWTDYPESYRNWFVAELFRALNVGPAQADDIAKRRSVYEKQGICWQDDDLAKLVESEQRKVDEGQSRYGESFVRLYGPQSAWGELRSWQTASLDEVHEQHRVNETSRHRVVGLVIETRPDTIDADALVGFRELGCTKVQIGVQSLRQDILDRNERCVTTYQVARAFELMRLFGFKIHAHFMANLYGSTPAEDKCDYTTFVEDPAYQPDEVKLYPCALIAGTRLCELFENGAYRPYTHEELMDVLVYAQTHTPAFMRISRMIRDFSSDDIVAGNKKPNLRQMVEQSIGESAAPVEEIRYREVSTKDVAIDELTMTECAYTTTVSDERFLQWVTPDGGIAGFLRLSLPFDSTVASYGNDLPICPGEAMIREVHVYGKVAGVHSKGTGAQHHGLGKQLISRACDIARESGYERINVISAVGTREYYRKLGFADNGLYQQLVL